MTDKTKPISSSNPPESRGKRLTDAETLKKSQEEMKKVESAPTNFREKKTTTTKSK